MPFQWPPGFARIPEDDWTRAPIETLALKYDTVNHHGWYSNLDPTVEDLTRLLTDGKLLVDYSGGTGILEERLLQRRPQLGAGILVVDSSPKFLRLALDKFRSDERVAFRWLRYLKNLKRLEFLDEVLGDALLRRGADVIVSANAIHLYFDLEETLRSWVRVLRPAGMALVQSGNIRNSGAGPGEWIIDDTVEAIHRAAVEIVARDGRYERYRDVLSDPARMALYSAYREKIFPPVRPLHRYLRAFRRAGLRIHSVANRSVEAGVREWYEFLSVYHEGVLGWIGGVERVDGPPPEADAVADRLAVLRSAMQIVFEGRPTFPCCWTYIACGKA
jgi:SAM-dependent methyltransferase